MKPGQDEKKGKRKKQPDGYVWAHVYFYVNGKPKTYNECAKDCPYGLKTVRVRKSEVWS